MQNTHLKSYHKGATSFTYQRGNTFFNGLLVGVLLGVAMTVTLIIYIKGENSPFGDLSYQNENPVEVPIKKKISEEQIKPNSNEGLALDDPNKFDFYTILPETESKVTEQEINNKPIIKQESYFLQVGAFAKEDDANNLKTKLALQGFEALVQTAEIPNKGTMHRVRIGPLSDLETINKMRSDLQNNGFNADLIKVHVETSNQ